LFGKKIIYAIILKKWLLAEFEELRGLNILVQYIMHIQEME
jgi:hypothetical protein